MKWIAMLSMLVDHIGIVFFPDDWRWRLIGRIAFPIYAYGIAQGLIHTHNRRRYMIRLAIIAGAAQIPYMIALNSIQICVVGTFIFVAWVIGRINRFKTILGQGFLLVIAIIMLDSFKFEYGSYALLLILAYQRWTGHRLVFAHATLNLIYLICVGWILQLASIIPTLMIAYKWPSFSAKVPAWLWRSFYPAHLIMLCLIVLYTR